MPIIILFHKVLRSCREEGDKSLRSKRLKDYIHVAQVESGFGTDLLHFPSLVIHSQPFLFESTNLTAVLLPRETDDL